MLPVFAVRARRGDLFDIDPEDFGEPCQDGVAVDAAPAAFHRGEAGVRPAEAAREQGLRRAPAPPCPCDPLPRLRQGHHVAGVRAMAGSAAITALQGGSLRSYGAPGSNKIWMPMPPSVPKLATNAGWLAS